MRLSIPTIYFFLVFVVPVPAQLLLTGKVEPSPSGKWGNKLYVLRIDRLGLSKPNLVDSIKLNMDGSFTHKFSIDPQGILYQIRQPLKGHGLNATISGFEDHWFYISTEEKGEVKLKGHADSLYYSLEVTKGVINRKLLLFREIKRPIEKIARAASDSIKAHPSKKDFYREKFMKMTIDEADKAKQKIILILDTCKNTTLTLAGLIYLNEASLGNLSGEQIKKYSSSLHDDDVILIRNAKKAVNDIDRNRIGIVIPDVAFRDNQGNQKQLISTKSKFKVLDFWASWCGPCRYANINQLPELNKFLTANGIPLIAITIDKDVKKWKQAVKTDKTTWHQVIDPTYSLSKILDIQGVPSYLILGENNEIVYEASSLILIKKFLKEKVTN